MSKTPESDTSDICSFLNEQLVKEKAFLDVVKDVYETNEQLFKQNENDLKKYFSWHLCPDQYVGIIGSVKNHKRFWRKNLEEIDLGNRKVMILVLESPHQDEFQYSDDDSLRLPIGPANGATGVNIWKYIAEVFKDKFNDFSLILMNAIPFQCSLGAEPPGSIRDKVFAKAWDDANQERKKIGASFFEKRLGSLLKKLAGNEVVIVNACTQGNKGKKWSTTTKNDLFLCCKVCKSIIEVLKNCPEGQIPFYHIHHPSSWTRNKKTLEIDERATKRSIEFPTDGCKECKKCYAKITYKE